MVQESGALKWRALICSALAATSLLLGGCRSAQLREPVASETTPLPQPSAPNSPNLPPPPPPSRPIPPPRENHLSPATRALVTQSHARSSTGDLDGASSTLDRALRIEPSNPLLWVERGRLRLLEGDARQAESCARKALALASGDRAAQAQAGRLLADALSQQGRNPQAAEVERQPYMH